MDEKDLQVVFTGPKPVADIVRGLLGSEGIPAALSTDDAGGARPDLGFSRGARVLVSADDAEQALELIRSFEDDA